jgi:hypothetical protein
MQPASTVTSTILSLLGSTLFAPDVVASLVSGALEVASGHPGALSDRFASIVDSVDADGAPTSVESLETRSGSEIENPSGTDKPKTLDSPVVELKLTLPDGTLHHVWIDPEKHPNLMDDSINPLLGAGIPIDDHRDRISTKEIRQESISTPVTEKDIRWLIDLAIEQKQTSDSPVSETANINTKLLEISQRLTLQLWFIVPATTVSVGLLVVTFWGFSSDIRQKLRTWRARRVAARMARGANTVGA